MLKRGRMFRCLALAIVVPSVIAGFSCAQDQQSSSAADALSGDQARALAGRILKRANKANCHPNSCTLLVANFTTPSGSTSRLGIQLADSISDELRAQGSGIQIVDRSRLRDYLVREHIPASTLKDREAARWLATEFQANAVLLGRIERLGDHFNLLIELLNISNDKVGPQEAMQIAIAAPQEAFTPFEPYDEERSPGQGTPTPGSNSPRAGVNGVGVPNCTYCPPPRYTDPARKAKFNGYVVLQVNVTEEGRAADIRVLKGVPFGLNGAAIKAVTKWSFKPANYEGKPASVMVPIEVTFRLY
jgi:TonB family protein